MVHHVTQNYASSPLLNAYTVSAPSVARTSKSTSASSTSTGTTSTGDIGSTFLGLLTEELQNQDPTDPMDSTAMVGQMISLNQLDQLVSINQILGGNPGSLTAATSNAPSAVTAMQNKSVPSSPTPTSVTPSSFTPATTAVQPQPGFTSPFLS